MAAVEAAPRATARAPGPKRFPLGAWALGGTGLGLSTWAAAEMLDRVAPGTPASFTFPGLSSLDRALSTAAGAGAGLPLAAQLALSLCFAGVATWASLAVARRAEALAAGRPRAR
jgi:hypothetical protein